MGQQILRKRERAYTDIMNCDINESRDNVDVDEGGDNIAVDESSDNVDVK